MVSVGCVSGADPSDRLCGMIPLGAVHHCYVTITVAMSGAGIKFSALKDQIVPCVVYEILCGNK